jgi:hypothetical protein
VAHGQNDLRRIRTLNMIYAPLPTWSKICRRNNAWPRSVRGLLQVLVGIGWDSYLNPILHIHVMLGNIVMSSPPKFCSRDEGLGGHRCQCSNGVGKE